MTFTVSYSLENEKNGLLMQLEKVSDGWFLPHGWYVLPDNQNNPQLPICIIPSDLVSQLSPANLPLPRINKLFNKINPNTFSTDFQKYWSQVHFYIHPVRYGTYGYWTYDTRPYHIHLYIRQDQPAEILLEIAISSIHKLIIKDDLSWNEREAIGDYVTKLIFPTYIGTLDRMSQPSHDLLTRSIVYLRELHAPVGQLLTEHNNLLYYQDKILNPLLSPSERLFLSFLIKNYSFIVTYDQLSDIIYGKQADTKYSLWGLRKVAQRVRQKLSRTGVPSNIIQNHPGQGYILN